MLWENFMCSLGFPFFLWGMRKPCLEVQQPTVNLKDGSYSLKIAEQKYRKAPFPDDFLEQPCQLRATVI
jgi:hypothetical protein